MPCVGLCYVVCAMSVVNGSCLSGEHYTMLCLTISNFGLVCIIHCHSRAQREHSGCQARPSNSVHVS
jgi:hypothetical protein